MPRIQQEACMQRHARTGASDDVPRLSPRLNPTQARATTGASKTPNLAYSGKPQTEGASPMAKGTDRQPCTKQSPQRQRSVQTLRRGRTSVVEGSRPDHSSL